MSVSVSGISQSVLGTLWTNLSDILSPVPVNLVLKYTDDKLLTNLGPGRCESGTGISLAPVRKPVPSGHKPRPK
ncbi:hypothetical protein GLOTRDRAFT_140683 [Gloeophyllum trabeum ATCC 11539]|uniref:Uncharacterized protein n=1 Tax=Gloeophyllum trabeum (strain ATCC 11539 / FP-39264 / Madison 617) TaxID=670483 RepID=S7RDN3_GLOTA|nr:uncharacterized protein GLOTRDRAFT_140683 [Gloeophyllum trabeum ATCC 11539]EPQ52330.1 hypothetical protein GLOTRDRAFT_140683 [Gloeophyllum trabeum ATCC 11539]